MDSTLLDSLPIEEHIKNTISLCPHCLHKIPAEVFRREGEVWMRKKCECRDDSIEALLSSDASHYYQANPDVSDLEARCSACHCGDQATNHSCNMLIEITQRCNLTCPTCYAGSSPESNDTMLLEEFKSQIDGLIERGKGSADLIQLSGGEPSIHPDLFDMIKYALDAGVRRVYLNTNGIKLSSVDFARRISECGESGRVAVYLQFDGFRKETYSALRNRGDLLQVKQKAIGNCRQFGIPIVPIMTATNGINDDELGAFLQWASQTVRVSKVMLQPAMYSGRYQNPKRVDRMTAADVIKNISKQLPVFSEADFTPIPCSDPNCFIMALALNTPKGLLPVSRYFPKYDTWGDPSVIEVIEATADQFDRASSLEAIIKWAIENDAFRDVSGEQLDHLIEALIELKNQQAVDGKDDDQWEGLFAIGIKPFMDAWTFDQDRIDKCCTHIIGKDGTPVSFCEYNAINRPTGNL